MCYNMVFIDYGSVCIMNIMTVSKLLIRTRPEKLIKKYREFKELTRNYTHLYPECRTQTEMSEGEKKKKKNKT